MCRGLGVTQIFHRVVRIFQLHDIAILAVGILGSTFSFGRV